MRHSNSRRRRRCVSAKTAVTGIALALITAGMLSGCNKKDPAIEAYEGPGQAKAGAPSMGPGGTGPGVTKPAPPVSTSGGMRRK